MATFDPSPLQSLLPPDAMLTDEDRVAPYAIPERGLPGQTPLVLLPRTPEEVRAVIAEAAAHGVPLVISAGRTGLVEAQRPDGEVVLSLERLRRFERIVLADGTAIPLESEEVADGVAKVEAYAKTHPDADWTEATIVCQGGVAIDALNAVLKPVRRMFPMVMASTATATIGGCVANASAGANAVCYGTAAEMAVEVSGVNGHGEVVRETIGPRHDSGPDRPWIDSALWQMGISLAGSQGALGVITEVRARTYPIPQQREGVLLAFPSLQPALELLEAARETFPNDVEEFEFMSEEALDLVRRAWGEDFRCPFPSTDSLEFPWFVLLQVKGSGDEDLQERLLEFILDRDFPEDRVAVAPLADLKSIRHSITESSNLRAGSFREQKADQVEEYRIAFDLAVPLNRFDAYLTALGTTLRKRFPMVEPIMFGHLGVGGVHLHVLRVDGRKVTPLKGDIIREVLDITSAYNGTFSAEHGVGAKWNDAFLQRTPADVLAEMRAAMKAWDPAGVLNPRVFGKGSPE